MAVVVALDILEYSDPDEVCIQPGFPVQCYFCATRIRRSGSFAAALQHPSSPLSELITEAQTTGSSGVE